MTHPQVELGNQGLKVGRMGLGCLSLTGHHQPFAGDEAARATIARALDLGVTMFDTADVYGAHRNEEFVGEATRGRRDDVVIATKFGIVANSGPISDRIRGDAEYVRAACEASLVALGVDHIDLYYAHRVDPKTPIEETVGAMAELVLAGKVRFIGLCEPGPETLERAHAVHPITAIQSEWSLWSRDVETGIVPLAKKLGIGVVPTRPLGAGFLAGRIRSIDDLDPSDGRRGSPRFSEENFRKNLELLDRLEQLAIGLNCSPAQLALGWLVSRGVFVVPIPGADRPEYVEANVAALDIRFSSGDLDAIDQLFPIDAAAGDRYADMAWVSIEAPGGHE